jgi:hypothetical protein
MPDQFLALVLLAALVSFRGLPHPMKWQARLAWRQAPLVDQHVGGLP